MCLSRAMKKVLIILFLFKLKFSILNPKLERVVMHKKMYGNVCASKLLSSLDAQKTFETCIQLPKYKPICCLLVFNLRSK